MGFGGSSFNGTLNVDLVQTDVQAIVDGITGYDHRTLMDIDNHLQTIGGYLFDGNSYTSIYSQVDSLRQSVDALRLCLFQDYIQRPAIDVLLSIESILNTIAYNTSN